VILCEITRLDRETYVEMPVGTIEPEGFRGARRTHTYTTAGGWEAADALVRRPRLAGLIGGGVGLGGRRPAGPADHPAS
jgi:hypothetical protein